MPYDNRNAETPKWANSYERDVDLSDVWMEEMDPSNEFGEICTGYFSQDRHDRTCALRLEGIGVEDLDGTRFYDRNWLLRAFGESRVWHLEQLEMETA